MINYAIKKGISIKASIEKPYSVDANLIHVSHEADILEDPRAFPPEEIYSWIKNPKDAPDREVIIEIHFKKGESLKMIDRTNGIEKIGSLELFDYLNYLGAENGIGRVDMVENRFVGIKNCGIYESPAMTILHIGHKDIEVMVMDREAMGLKDMLSAKFAELVYYGFWYLPEINFLRAAIDKSQ